MNNRFSANEIWARLDRIKNKDRLIKTGLLDTAPKQVHRTQRTGPGKSCSQAKARGFYRS